MEVTEEGQSALRHASTVSCLLSCCLAQYSCQVLPISHGSSWDRLHIWTFSSFVMLPFLLLLSQTGICQMCTCTSHHCGHRGNGSAQPIGVTGAPNPPGRLTAQLDCAESRLRIVGRRGDATVSREGTLIQWLLTQVETGNGGGANVSLV